MNGTVADHELWLRTAAFAAVFAAVALWEMLRPRRPRQLGRSTRWLTNLGLLALDTLVLRLVFPAAAVGAAVLAEEAQLGILRWLAWPVPISLLLSLLALDLAVYLQHAVFHAIPLFWRLHLVHHADPEFDVSTGLRFHPAEILISMLWKIAIVLSLGPPAAAVVAFEVLLNATSLFNHANARLPLALDRVLRLFLVTPDMHRVHHSVLPHEANSNFGFNLPWWDRLLGTYRAQPSAGHDAMRIGLEQLRERPFLGLGALLALPFRADPGRYPMGSRDQPDS
jgi:sterol desaturase/sphingolipid hydroxylase (fatty acid hydroxylase superfamily)